MSICNIDRSQVAVTLCLLSHCHVQLSLFLLSFICMFNAVTTVVCHCFYTNSKNPVYCLLVSAVHIYICVYVHTPISSIVAFVHLLCNMHANCYSKTTSYIIITIIDSQQTTLQFMLKSTDTINETIYTHHLRHIHK